MWGKLDAVIWADLVIGHAGISMVGEHSKNELKIGSDQAKEINLVLGMAPRKEASCPNHRVGSDMGQCQCQILLASRSPIPVSPVRPKPSKTTRASPTS